ncbi:MAG: hypothetical protein ACREMY_14170, partial [bacterium]
MVLQTGRKAVELASMSESASHTAQHCKELVEEVELPHTREEEPLRFFFAEVKQRKAAQDAADLNAARIGGESGAARRLHKQAAARLAVIVRVIAARHTELAQHEVLLAASHLASKALAASASQTYGIDWHGFLKEEVAEVASAAAEQAADATDQTRLAAMEGTLMETARKVGAILKEAPAAVAALEAVSGVACPDVRKPVRPTDEEVQRYLRALEKFMLARQTTHREAARAMGFMTESQQTVAATLNQLADLVRAMKGEAGSAGFSALIATAERLTEATADASTILGNAPKYNVDELDVVERTKPERREARSIEQLRKLMLAVGYAFGRLNEAQTAFNATNKIAAQKVELDGVLAAASTWQECLEWRKQKGRDMEAADKANEGKAAKLELLTQSVETYQQQERDGMRDLYRLVVTTMPGKDEQA